MHKRLKAAVAPVVVTAAITWAGIARAQGPEARSQRLDELGEARPAAASHRHVDGVLTAASQAVDEERWIEGAQRRQLEVFYEGMCIERSRPLHRRRVGRKPERPERERCLGLLPDHARHVGELVQRPRSARKREHASAGCVRVASAVELLGGKRRLIRY